MCEAYAALGFPSVPLIDYHSSGCSPHQYVFKAFILPNWAPLFSVLMMAGERIACQCEWLGLNWAAVYTLHKAMVQITLRIENGAWERPLRACGTEIKYKPRSLISLLLFSASSLHLCHVSILLNVFIHSSLYSFVVFCKMMYVSIYSVKNILILAYCREERCSPGKSYYLMLLHHCT